MANDLKALRPCSVCLFGAVMAVLSNYRRDISMNILKSI